MIQFLFKNVRRIQTRMLLMVMRQVVPRLELVANHFLQDDQVIYEDQTKKDLEFEECRMLQSKAYSIAQDVTHRYHETSMVPIRWVEGQKDDLGTRLSNIQNCLVKTPVKTLQAGASSFTESVQIKLWEMSWFVVLLAAHQTGTVKNKIIDIIELAVGAAEVLKK